MDYYRKEVSITDLLLDPENPRHEVVESQAELIKTIVLDQNKKLTTLAKDICEYGVNPSDLPHVIPYESSAQYIVMEGNRRLTALKLLHTPSLVPNSASSSFKETFKELSKTFRKKSIDNLLCTVHENRKSARHWIELKHTGENNGAGTVQWEAIARNRFDAAAKGHTPELQVIEFLLNEGSLNEEDKKFFNTPPISTVKRLVGDPYVRDHFGLKIEAGRVVSTLTKTELARSLIDFLMPFMTGKKKVAEIYYKGDRQKYIDGLPEYVFPDLNNITDKQWELLSPPKVTKRISPEKQSQGKPSKKRLPLSGSRTTLIPKDCILRIPEARINNIYVELMEIDIGRYTNAVAVLFRVFLEASVAYFIENNTLAVHPKSNLATKVSVVLNYFKNKKTMTDDERKPVRVAVTSQHSIMSIDTFHAYVHNPDFHPSEQELKTNWNNLQTFMEKIWE